MKTMPLSRAFTLIEPGPVVWVCTSAAGKHNIMTISWTMVMDFTPRLALTTGPWNHSFAALQSSRECVIAIPSADMLDVVVGVGMCSGRDTDKFARFGLTALKGKKVAAPLIGECMANIECRVVDFLDDFNIVVLDGVVAHEDEARGARRMLHAVGDGTFVADGERFDRRAAMAAKLPDGC
jgi:flavin reductase (DIM6/NTAB) family NADH-FMN oxidoreductase RutF